jgi:hypothetical protein
VQIKKLKESSLLTMGLGFTKFALNSKLFPFEEIPFLKVKFIWLANLSVCSRYLYFSRVVGICSNLGEDETTLDPKHTKGEPLLLIFKKINYKSTFCIVDNNHFEIWCQHFKKCNLGICVWVCVGLQVVNSMM